MTSTALTAVVENPVLMPAWWFYGGMVWTLFFVFFVIDRVKREAPVSRVFQIGAIIWGCSLLCVWSANLFLDGADLRVEGTPGEIIYGLSLLASIILIIIRRPVKLRWHLLVLLGVITGVVLEMGSIG